MAEETRVLCALCITNKMIDGVKVSVRYDVAVPEVTNEEARAYVMRGRRREPTKTLSYVRVDVREEDIRLSYSYEEKPYECIPRIQPEVVQSDESNEFHCPKCKAPIDEVEMREVVTLEVQPDGTFWIDQHVHYQSNFCCPVCDAQLAAESTGYGEEFRIVDDDPTVG